jgi:hypothetical protein
VSPDPDADDVDRLIERVVPSQGRSDKLPGRAIALDFRQPLIRESGALPIVAGSAVVIYGNWLGRLTAVPSMRLSSRISRLTIR